MLQSLMQGLGSARVCGSSATWLPVLAPTVPIKVTGQLTVTVLVLVRPIVGRRSSARCTTLVRSLMLRVAVASAVVAVVAAEAAAVVVVCPVVLCRPVSQGTHLSYTVVPVVVRGVSAGGV
ncbi:hypothetical protein [Corynebacterium bovis]|uniref:hypothetical protein n=1 Tax=Corynebacterium bovis TaxID=36808 RepID=UPI000F649AAE|nr:hypothetical protein [Corynebacterium bovis]RRQ12018.1 hypothetical protein CXF47_10670 [Corynebacterium bovis]